jgi:hypothetical protein
MYSAGSARRSGRPVLRERVRRDTLRPVAGSIALASGRHRCRCPPNALTWYPRPCCCPRPTPGVRGDARPARHRGHLGGGGVGEGRAVRVEHPLPRPRQVAVRRASSGRLMSRLLAGAAAHRTAARAGSGSRAPPRGTASAAGLPARGVVPEARASCGAARPRWRTRPRARRCRPRRRIGPAACSSPPT